MSAKLEKTVGKIFVLVQESLSQLSLEDQKSAWDRFSFYVEHKRDLGKTIAELKENQQGRSMREYATSLGCNVSTLSRIYSSEKLPGEKMLANLEIEKKRWR